MRVLVAGDRGYIGAVLVPFLRAAGHEVDGLGCRSVRRVRPRSGAAGRRDESDARHAERHGRGPRRIRRRALPGCTVQRPARQPQPRGDVLGEPRRDAEVGTRRQAGRHRALPVLLILQPLRCRGVERRGGGRRTVPRHAVRRDQGSGRTRTLPARRRQLQPCLPSQRDRVSAPQPGSAWTSW